MVETGGWEFALIDGASGSVEEDACGPSEVVERSKVHVASRECPLAFGIQNTSRQRCEDGCFKERGCASARGLICRSVLNLSHAAALARRSCRSARHSSREPVMVSEAIDDSDLPRSDPGIPGPLHKRAVLTLAMFDQTTRNGQQYGEENVNRRRLRMRLWRWGSVRRQP